MTPEQQAELTELAMGADAGGTLLAWQHHLSDCPQCRAWQKEPRRPAADGVCSFGREIRDQLQKHLLAGIRARPVR